MASFPPADDGLEGLLRAWVPGSEFAGLAFAVGGFVRDRLLGLDAKDLDVAVERAGGAEALAKALHAAFPDSLSSPHLLGRGYPIWSLSFREDVRFGGRLYRTRGEVLEMADTQAEAFPDPASRQRVSRYGNLDEDAARRDFTVNMLYLDLATGALRDPSGQGLADLRAGRLAGHPVVELEKIFSDDPLRMLRLYRFHSRFGWEIAASAEAAVVRTRARFSILSAERVRDELTKLLLGSHVARALEGMRRSGLLAEALPELLPMVGCGQDAKYHSEGDVWVHTLAVVGSSPARVAVRWAALLHDVGKPATRSEDGDRVKFLGHEQVSASIAAALLARLKVDRSLADDVVRLVTLHLRGGDSLRWASLKPARKLAREAGPLLPDLLDLIEADSRSSLGPDGQPRLEHLVALRHALAEALKIPIRERPILDGRSVMECLGIASGPQLGRVLKELREQEDALAAEGLEWSPESAKEWLLSPEGRSRWYDGKKESGRDP